MKAPWKDCAGNDIHEGDVIRHPSGETGRVVFLSEASEYPQNQWRVDYGYENLSYLTREIGSKGQAVVVSPKSDSNKNPFSSFTDSDLLSAYDELLFWDSGSLLPRHCYIREVAESIPLPMSGAMKLRMAKESLLYEISGRWRDLVMDRRVAEFLKNLDRFG